MEKSWPVQTEPKQDFFAFSMSLCLWGSCPPNRKMFLREGNFGFEENRVPRSLEYNLGGRTPRSRSGVFLSDSAAFCIFVFLRRLLSTKLARKALQPPVSFCFTLSGHIIYGDFLNKRHRFQIVCHFRCLAVYLHTHTQIPPLLALCYCCIMAEK